MKVQMIEYHMVVNFDKCHSLSIHQSLSLSLSETHWVVTSPYSLFLSLFISIVSLVFQAYLRHLSFISEATDSVLFGKLPRDVYLPLKTENVTANYHSWALTPKVCTIPFLSCTIMNSIHKIYIFQDTSVY